MREKKDEHEDKEEEEGIGRRLLGRFDPFERVPIAKKRGHDYLGWYKKSPGAILEFKV